MNPERKSQSLLGVTRSKAKMLEYHVPEEYHIEIKQDPAQLFRLSIGILGDLAAGINRPNQQDAALVELRRNLNFSAHFFDAYLQSKLNETLDPYLELLGSASYYLCDLPGSSMVLAKRIGEDCPPLDGEGLEDLLLWLLKGDQESCFMESEGRFGPIIDFVSQGFFRFYRDGNNSKTQLDLSLQLRREVYESGSPRQLLLGDVIAAVIKKKIENSTWNAIPAYSGLSRNKWEPILRKSSFIKELWPAQHLLGQAGVLQGKSAVVQMPTSAGKTKAIEMVIRSAFLADRTSLAIIVAPFRALCREIKINLNAAFQNESILIDELSDTIQVDFDIAEILDKRRILVVTPEKLLFVLRQSPELATNVGLVIFDEGHQFDSGPRGIIYELLLTSLRLMLPKEVQKVLISAVISNAKAIGTWLNGDDSRIVAGANLIPTFRSIGFASWVDQRGRIEYVSSDDAEKSEFFVPRVIEGYPLQRKKGESKTKVRVFPDKNNVDVVGKEVALYLGLKLMQEGAVAVFCGRKSTASILCDMITDKYSRNLSLNKPSEYSDPKEMAKLIYLHTKNLGLGASATRSAQLGIFSHHGNTPHGIRLAVEHAMREGFIRFVICTSTLAQGVNLPIRYLIVTSVYQGLDRIKVRDFHNLIGRAGRAGMHTEGSILFADPVVYDRRKSRNDKWRWVQVKELLEAKNSEPCISNLLSLFEPIKSDDEKTNIIMDALDFAKAYISAPESFTGYPERIAQLHADKFFSKEGIQRQISWKTSLISAIESFLLSNWDASVDGFSESGVVSLAEGTLAYFLADEEKRAHIKDLFKLLADNISNKIDDVGRRKAYGRTLYGMRDAQEVDDWVRENIGQLSGANTDDEILAVVWPILIKHVHNGVFIKCDKPDVLLEMAREWISGRPFHELLSTLEKGGAKLIWGKKRREFKIDHVVEICEGGLAYDGAMLIGALTVFIKLAGADESCELISRLQSFQKKLKYGLPTAAATALYEVGFSDRVIALDLASSLSLVAEQRKEVSKALKNNKSTSRAVIEKYPNYFQDRMNEFL